MRVKNQPLMVIHIPHEHILSQDFEMVKQFFNKIVSKFGKRARGSAVIAFSGYDDIPDEVFEIKEVRDYVKQLFKKYPHILYYMSEDMEAVNVLLSCLCDVDSVFLGEEKLSMTQYLERGLNPVDQNIGLLLNITVPQDTQILIKEAILKHGKRMKDVTGATKIVQMLERKYFKKGENGGT